jgi:hypothetical protein
LNDADALSRLEFKHGVDEEVSHVDYIFESNFEATLVSMDEISLATNECNLLKRLKKRIVSGKWGQVSQMEKPYKTVKSALSIENNVVVYGTKIVVPPALRRKVLESAHDPIAEGRGAVHIRVCNL